MSTAYNQISHHTSHTMGNGASSSNQGIHGNGTHPIGHHTSHTMGNGASSSSDGINRDSDTVKGGGVLQRGVLATSLTGPVTQLPGSTIFNMSHERNNYDQRDTTKASLAGPSTPSFSGLHDESNSSFVTAATSVRSCGNLGNFSIIDSTLREGEQFATAYFNTAQKLEIAQALDDFGVDYIEVTSPAASPQSRADCEAICKLGLKAKILCHIRCNMNDARIAMETGVDGINMCIGTSQQLMEHSHGKDLTTIAAMAAEVIEYVKSNKIEIRFSGEDSFRSDFDEILKLYSHVSRLGVDRVGIADTVGGATPREVFDKISTLRRVVGCDIETHFHNDTGCAIANAYIALEAGATHIDTTVLGIGERNGITPLGALVASVSRTDREYIWGKYKVEKLRYLESMVAQIVGVEIPFNHFALPADQSW